MRAVMAWLLAGAAGLQAARPISKDALSGALKRGGLTNAELAEAIRSTGAGFALSPADESALQALGADGPLLAAVKASRVASNVKSGGRPLTAVELLLKLYHGNPTKAGAAVQARGVAFDLTPPLEAQLIEAGAGKALLALAALRRLEFEAAAPGAAAPAEAPPESAPPAVPAPAGPRAVRIDAAVQSRKLLKKPEAEYPQLALRARMNGTAVVEALIGRDGRVRRVRHLRGDATFAEAAMDAVRNYLYRPTLLDEQPIDVVAEVTVEFDVAKADLGMKN
jgi:TonB family protein